MTDKQALKLLQNTQGILRRMPCMFWACKGPNKRPENMITCHRCWQIYNLQKRIGRLQKKVKSNE